MTDLAAILTKVVEDIDAEIRVLQERRESIIRGNTHYRCEDCEWYCTDLACTDEHSHPLTPAEAAAL